MIWHFGEVFVLMAVAFAIGCFIGALVHSHFAVSRHHARQEALGSGLGRLVDNSARGAGELAGSAIRRSATLLKAREAEPAVSPGPAAPAEEAADSKGSSEEQQPETRRAASG